jgi:hypothetical protein
MDKVKFQTTDSEKTEEFYVVEQTRVNGVDYLLVAEEEEGDCTALILKDLSKEQEAEATYVIVEDENELEYVSKIFTSLLEDVDIVEA